MARSPNDTVRRRPAIRFQPDRGQYARISMQTNLRRFEPELRAEIIDESRTGCGLVLYNTPLLQEGDICVTQVGRLAPVHARVIWRREEGDDTALRVGLEYLP